MPSGTARPQQLAELARLAADLLEWLEPRLDPHELPRQYNEELGKRLLVILKFVEPGAVPAGEQRDGLHELHEKLAGDRWPPLKDLDPNPKENDPNFRHFCGRLLIYGPRSARAEDSVVLTRTRDAEIASLRKILQLIAAGGPNVKELTEDEKEIWDLLDAQCLLAKEIAHKFDRSDEDIRKTIERMRKKDYAIENMQDGRGYFRPDSPPLTAP